MEEFVMGRFLAILLPFGLLVGCVSAPALRFDAKRVEADLRSEFPIGMPWVEAEARLKEKSLQYSKFTQVADFSDMKETCAHIKSKFYVRSIVREERSKKLVSSALSFCLFFDEKDKISEYFFRVQNTGP